jgi:hypothetical protein
MGRKTVVGVSAMGGGWTSQGIGPIVNKCVLAGKAGTMYHVFAGQGTVGSIEPAAPFSNVGGQFAL